MVFQTREIYAKPGGLRKELNGALSFFDASARLASTSGVTQTREIYTKRWVDTENAGLGTRGTRCNKSLSIVVKVIAGTRGTR